MPTAAESLANIQTMFNDMQETFQADARELKAVLAAGNEDAALRKTVSMLAGNQATMMDTMKALIEALVLTANDLHKVDKEVIATVGMLVKKIAR